MVMILAVRKVLIVLGLILASFAVAATAAAQPGPRSCLRPAGAHEPPCNPALAPSLWPAPHRGAFERASSPYPGPAPGDPVKVQRLRGLPSPTPLLVPLFITFSGRYPDGGQAAWVSALSNPESNLVFKFDAETGDVVGSASRGTAEGATQSGAYSLLDRDGRLLVARDRGIQVYADVDPSSSRSPIRLVQNLRLPDAALCRPDDKLTGLQMLPDGTLGFTTRFAVVGVVPRTDLRPESVRSISLNGPACDDPDRDPETLEQVTQSQAADDRDTLYTVTSGAAYAHRWDGRRLRQEWRSPYVNDGYQGGIRQGTGSGTSPDVAGEDDQFIAITDGARVMNYVLLWRKEIPKDWEPVAPGVDRRIACQVPVTFGDPMIDRSQSEQSVLTYRNAGIVVQNSLQQQDLLQAAVSGVDRTLANQYFAFLGGNPAFAGRGMQRIDWDPATRTCRTRWIDRQVSIPNGVPTLSTQTGLVYAVGQRNGTWGLEANDFQTGESRAWWPVPGSDVTDNAFYSAAVIGPRGAIWTGTQQGVNVYRPPVKDDDLAMVCQDGDPPILRAVRVRRRGRDTVVTGRAADVGCNTTARARTVEVRIGRLARRAKVRSGRFRLVLSRPGARRLRIVAVDAAGNRSTTVRR